MTLEEASKDISFIIKCLNKRRMTPCGFCNEMKCTPVLSDCLPNDFVVNKAIQALEKQIPMKPKIIRKPTEKIMGAGDCPTCGGLVTEWAKYCSRCGQRLDWSDK